MTCTFCQTDIEDNDVSAEIFGANIDVTATCPECGQQFRGLLAVAELQES